MSSVRFLSREEQLAYHNKQFNMYIKKAENEMKYSTKSADLYYDLAMKEKKEADAIVTIINSEKLARVQKNPALAARYKKYMDHIAQQSDFARNADCELLKQAHLNEVRIARKKIQRLMDKAIS